MAETLRDFFTPEAGQRRRSWLNEIDGKIGETLAYYLGPQLAPRVEQAANIGALFSPGMDVQDAYTASGEMMAPNRSALDRAGAGAALAGSVAAMFMPGGVSSIRQGIDNLAEAGARGARSPTLGSNAGNLAAAAASETPAQQVARLLREGRGAEVTDELYAQADPQELSRLYDAGATGMDMPMGPAALERARAGGFDTGTPLYHGGRSDLAAVSPFEGAAEAGQGGLFSTSSPQVANTYARPLSMADAGMGGQNVTPLYGRTADYRQAGYTTPFPANGTDAEIDAWMAGLERFNRRLDGEGVKPAYFQSQAEAARADGLPGAVIREVEDNRMAVGTAIPSDVYMTLDPTSLRSRFARFDPRLSHLRNLSAGAAGAAALGAGALATQPGEAQAATVGDLLWQQEQAKRLRDYLGGVQ